MAFLTIIVLLVRPQENFLVIFESGNICLHRRVKWSATANGKLCSATKFVNRVSLRITSFVSAFTVKQSSSQELWCSAIAVAGCVSMWLNASSDHSCLRDPLWCLSHTFCKRHARYLVDFYIPTGTRPSMYLDTCMYIFVSSLVVPSSFLSWSIIASAVLSWPACCVAYLKMAQVKVHLAKYPDRHRTNRALCRYSTRARPT